MGIAMRNTSYSPLFNEGLDFSCAIFDDQGEMIAQAEFCPAHLGAIIYVVEWTICEIGRENFQPGRRRLPQRPLPRRLSPPGVLRHQTRLP